VTATQAVPVAVLLSSARQHTATADDLARRIINAMGEVRKQLREGQPAMPAARQGSSDLTELMVELGRLSEDTKHTGYARQRITAA
jgi:hypothetical protein